MFLFDEFTAVVVQRPCRERGVGGVGVNRQIDFVGCMVHHGNQGHAEIHTQTVDVQKPEERQRREDSAARRELYNDAQSISLS